MKPVILAAFLFLMQIGHSQFLESNFNGRPFEDAFNRRVQSICKQLFVSKYNQINDSAYLVVQIPVSPDPTDLMDSSFWYIISVDSSSKWGLPQVSYNQNYAENNLLSWSTCYFSCYFLYKNIYYQRILPAVHFTYEEIQSVLSPENLQFLKEVFLLCYGKNINYVSSRGYPTIQAGDIASQYFLNNMQRPMQNYLSEFEQGRITATLDGVTTDYPSFYNSYGWDTLHDPTDPVMYIDISPAALYLFCDSAKNYNPYLNIKNHHLWFVPNKDQEKEFGRLNQKIREWSAWTKS